MSPLLVTVLALVGSGAFGAAVCFGASAWTGRFENAGWWS